MITDTDLWDIINEKNIKVNDIFMKDEPSSHINYGGYIINLQDQELNEGGTHWVSIWFPLTNKEDIIYMDSFGFICPQSVINWIRRRGGKYSHCKILCNSKQIQNVNTGGCGIYSLFFVDFIQRHSKPNDSEKLLKKWCKLWDNDTTNNLKLLKEYIPYYKDSEPF